MTHRSLRLAGRAAVVIVCLLVLRLLAIPISMPTDRPIALSLPSPFARLFAQGYSNTSANDYFVPPGACNSSVSGNATGTNGLTVLGTAPSIPVVQAQTSNSGTNTHYYVCTITPPFWIVTTSTGLQITSASFFYGVQTTGLGTQASVAASGTVNGAIVFRYIAYPAVGAGETATGLAEATRADSGTLGISSLANVATTTAGEFYSVTFTPASGTLAFKTDMRQLLLTVGLLNTATSATITNSPGAIVRVRSQ